MNQEPRQKGSTSVTGILLAIIIVLVVALVGAGLYALSFGAISGDGDLGPVIAQDVTVEGFSAVELNGFGNLYIEQGETEALRIEAAEKLMDRIAVEKRGDTLQIKYKSKWWIGIASLTTAEETNFYLTVKDLDSITLDGSGTINADPFNAGDLDIYITGSGEVDMNLTADTLNSYVSGSGDFELKGEVYGQTVEISGSGDYSAVDLQSTTALIRVSGSGKALVNVTGTLDVDVTGSGEVTYVGTPTVTQSISGSGNVRKISDDLFKD
ncbi:MAG: head GIN domain-containing protein [Candidatus Kerfeldbacteria bacterium]